MLVGMSMRPASRQRWTQRKTNGAPLAFLVMQCQICMPSPCLATRPVAKKTKVMRHESIWILILLLETWLQMVYISLHVVYLQNDLNVEVGEFTILPLWSRSSMHRLWEYCCPDPRCQQDHSAVSSAAPTTRAGGRTWALHVNGQQR